jgi:hypothetical protein
MRRFCHVAALARDLSGQFRTGVTGVSPVATAFAVGQTTALRVVATVGGVYGSP